MYVKCTVYTTYMKIFTYLGVVVALVVTYYVIHFFYRINISKKMVEETVPFTIAGDVTGNTMLILGDSTAVGIGASSPSFSVGGYIAENSTSTYTYVENHAVSGAVAQDLAAQIEKASLSSYDTILLQIGANDILRFHDVNDVVTTLEESLALLAKKSTTVIFISAGNLGGAPLIPFFMKKFYTQRTLDYHEAFEALSQKVGVTYVNLYMNLEEDPFIQNPLKNFARDTFHPSGDGYRIWYEIIKKAIPSL